MGHMVEGHHIGKITATMLSTTQNGTAQLAISLINKEGDYATKYLYFSSAALDWTRKQLLACGFTGNDVADLHGSELLVGNKIEFDIETEEYDGRERLKVGLLFEVGGAGGTRMTDDEARAFGEQMRSRIGGPSGDGAANLDDIPFSPDPAF